MRGLILVFYIMKHCSRAPTLSSTFSLRPLEAGVSR